MDQPSPNGKRHRPHAGQFGCDLEARVPAPDHQDVSAWDIRRPSVPSAVQLYDIGREILREAGHGRLLERPGGDDDLVGSDKAAVRFKQISVVALAKSEHVAARSDGQLERGRVGLQISSYLFL